MAVAVIYTLFTLTEVPSGTVEVQDAGTSTPRNIYTDTALSILATNPIPLDSAGRSEQGILYTAAGAYKCIVRDSTGQTKFTRDNIDPGVPLGTGILGLANGGTGGNDAASARASLEAVGTSDIEDLEAQVAALAGAAGSSERTGIAVGTTAQRPSVPAVGDIRYNTTTSLYEEYTASGWKNPYYTDSPLAGTVVKSSYTEYVAYADITTAIPFDDTIPQISEGTQIISVSFTPTSSTNKLRFRFSGMAQHSGGGNIAAALFGGGASNAIAATLAQAPANNAITSVNLSHEETSGTTSAKTFAVRVGPSASGTIGFNGDGTRKFGGVSKTTLIIEEIKV